MLTPSPMSTLLFLLASAVAMVCCVPDAQAGAIVHAPNSLGLAQGLVGWWTFDGNHMAGVHAYDASGNGNRGTLTNGPRLAEGKLGQAMEFDGGMIMYR